jgi:hypothetical protein
VCVCYNMAASSVLTLWQVAQIMPGASRRSACTSTKQQWLGF